MGKSKIHKYNNLVNSNKAILIQYEKDRISMPTKNTKRQETEKEAHNMQKIAEDSTSERKQSSPKEENFIKCIRGLKKGLKNRLKNTHFFKKIEEMIF